MLYFYGLAMSTPFSTFSLVIETVEFVAPAGVVVVVAAVSAAAAVVTAAAAAAAATGIVAPETMDEERLLCGALAKTAPEHPGYDS